VSRNEEDDVTTTEQRPDEASARRFSPDRLARLMEITSKVQCECPNHVARLVDALASFEEYALGCQDRNAADREVHGLLRASGRAAREIMESALEVLVKFEGIDA
jgi:hypothetical protein